MTRRLRVPWPDARPFAGRGGEPIRLLAVSDVREAAFDWEPNRAALGPVDAVLGCGDLEPEYLNFLGDAFAAPILSIRGNHDRGGQWQASTARGAAPLTPGSVVETAGIRIAALEWPGLTRPGNDRHEGIAWRHVAALTARLLWRGMTGRRGPWLVISHAAPAGVGDTPDDRFHAGFRAYRWLLERLRPRLWLHGHTALAAVTSWREEFGDSIVVNVTGAVLVELTPDGRAA